MSNITKLLMLLVIGLLLAAASIWLIGGKKKVYSIATNINARPQQLFPYLIEPELKKQWLPSIVNEELIPSLEDIENDREPVFAENAKIISDIEFEGRPLRMNGRVIRFTKDQLVSVKYSNEELSLTYFFRLKPKTNSTEVEFQKIIRFDGFKRFTSVFAEDNNKALLQQEISQLSKLIEDSSGSGQQQDEP